MTKRKQPLFLSIVPGRGPSDVILIAPLVFQEIAANIGYGLVAFVLDMLGDTPARRRLTNEAHVRSANIQEHWDRETHRVHSVLTDDCDRLATKHDWIRGDELANVDDYRQEQASPSSGRAVVEMDFDLANQLVVDGGQSVESVGGPEARARGSVPERIIAQQNDEIAEQAVEIERLRQKLAASQTGERTRPGSTGEPRGEPSPGEGG